MSPSIYDTACKSLVGKRQQEVASVCTLNIVCASSGNLAFFSPFSSSSSFF